MTKIKAIKALRTCAGHIVLSANVIQKLVKPFEVDGECVELAFTRSDQGCAAYLLSMQIANKLGITYPEMGDKHSQLIICCDAMLGYLEGTDLISKWMLGRVYPTQHIHKICRIIGTKYPFPWKVSAASKNPGTRISALSVRDARGQTVLPLLTVPHPYCYDSTKALFQYIVHCVNEYGETKP